MNWKFLIVAVVGSAVIATATVWQIQSWRYKTAMAEQAARHAMALAAMRDSLNRITEEAALQLVAHQEQRRQQTAALADLDTQHYQELRRAQAENARLRADIDSGHIRVPVIAICPIGDKTGAGDLPYASAASGLDDGTVRAGLHPEVARSLITIGGHADECAEKLTALQKWLLAHQ